MASKVNKRAAVKAPPLQNMSTERQEIEQAVEARIRMRLQLVPTPGQDSFIRAFARFAAEAEPGMFILKGYAGTGKTTMMSALTSAFRNIVLLAPTGRAAKVLATHTGRSAFTIHKHLYRPQVLSDGRTMLVLADNPYSRALFIVDEASMIPDATAADSDSGFPGVNLLSDLVRYVFSNPGNRLMFVGDTAQLPPVHFEDSPALDKAHLESRFGRNVRLAELTEVVRQKQTSVILTNATRLREHIRSEEPINHIPNIDLANDVVRISGNEFPEQLQEKYRSYGAEQVMVVTRSNRSAIQYNKIIRFQTLWMEDEIGGGDRILVARNNYFWLPKDHTAGFIANGDMLEVRKVYNHEERFGFRFAMAHLTYSDLPDDPPFEAMVLLDALHAESPGIPREQQQQLIDALHEHYMSDEPDRRRRSALLKKDPFFNALHVKFAYAITCHKAQGGQWPVVFVDQGYLTEEQMDKSFYRWLYTAMTRASHELFLVNFNDKFFGK
ncbi:MAG: ATP-dependent RecD-like DNA helicase [Bacteroidota bacterium]